MTRHPRFSRSRLFRGTEGVGLIEFAFALPILLILLAGVIEMTRFVLANQKVDKTATSLADFLGQQEDPGDFNVNTLDSAFNKLLDPFDSSTAGYIVSGVALAADKVTPKIIWRKTRGAVGVSKVGPAVGATANINGAKLQEGEQVIAAEVYYRHSTIINDVGSISEALDFDGEQLYKLAISLKRVPDQPVAGTKQNVPTLYGCCGQYCKEGDPLNEADTDWLPQCACFKFPLCEFDKTDERYDEPYAPNSAWPTVTRGEQRKFVLDHYCQKSGMCAIPVPDPCELDNTCPPPEPCEPADSCACDSSKCKSGGV